MSDKYPIPIGMNKKRNTMQRNKIQRLHYTKLILISLIIGLVTSGMAYSLKIITEHAEEFLWILLPIPIRLYFIIAPSIGITMIYFLRKYLFLNRKNKGIAEIYKTLDQRKDHLPFFKIPSHYTQWLFNRYFWRINRSGSFYCGGNGYRGECFYEKNFTANVYKLELIWCCGAHAAPARPSRSIRPRPARPGRSRGRAVVLEQGQDRREDGVDEGTGLVGLLTRSTAGSAPKRPTDTISRDTAAQATRA